MTKLSNIFGSPKAENDHEMLDKAFIDSADYQGIISSTFVQYIVGRRGTGKSALYYKAVKHFKNDKSCFVLEIVPTEHEMLFFSTQLKDANSDYKILRAVSKVVWRAYILLSCAQNLTTNYKAASHTDYQYIKNALKNNQSIFSGNNLSCCCAILAPYLASGDPLKTVPYRIVVDYGLDTLEKAVCSCLSYLGKEARIFIDRLDEGWSPTTEATSIIGGLATCISDFTEHQTPIKGTLFARDNMFRALSRYDTDFPRNIESSTIRLHWTDRSLLNLVTNRIRVSLKLELESDVKVWNRFAHRELNNHEGFKKCLESTLYRPRDILVLLNSAYSSASREGRSEIVGSDVEIAANSISNERLNDLLNEYSVVFPALNIIVNEFAGGSVRCSKQTILDKLGFLMEKTEYRTNEDADFAILGSVEALFDALYGIGFIGIEKEGKYIFCHDGSTVESSSASNTTTILIHPCYWRSLSLVSTGSDSDFVMDVYDEYGEQSNKEELERLSTTRIKKIGSLVSSLSNIPTGKEGAKLFEDLVLRSLQILFSGILSNFQMNPNPNDVQRRDIVATNMAEKGFWKRVLDDHSARQQVFEVKNYAELTPDDYRQVGAYLTKEYGRFVVIVYRSNKEGLTNKERNWVKEFWDKHNIVIFLLPYSILAHCLKKMRSPKHEKTTDKTLSKRLDTFMRQYVGTKSR